MPKSSPRRPAEPGCRRRPTGRGGYPDKAWIFGVAERFPPLTPDGTITCQVRARTAIFDYY